MKVTKFNINGPLLIEPKVFGDARGFFTERFRKDFFTELGLPEFIQDNYSRSAPRVLRGLHYQYDLPQSKLVTAVSGTIFDVAVDIRKGSPTLGKSVFVELSGDRPAWFWVPEGFAHGFQALSGDGADVLYKVNAPYIPSSEGGIRWNDPILNIPWPIMTATLNERDASLTGWQRYLENPRF